MFEIIHNDYGRITIYSVKNDNDKLLFLTFFEEGWLWIDAAETMPTKVKAIKSTTEKTKPFKRVNEIVAERVEKRGKPKA